MSHLMSYAECISFILFSSSQTSYDSYGKISLNVMHSTNRPPFQNRIDPFLKPPTTASWSLSASLTLLGLTLVSVHVMPTFDVLLFYSEDKNDHSSVNYHCQMHQDEEVFYQNFGTVYHSYGTVYIISGQWRVCQGLIIILGQSKFRGRKLIIISGHLIMFVGQPINILGRTVWEIKRKEEMECEKERRGGGITKE